MFSSLSSFSFVELPQIAAYLSVYFIISYVHYMYYYYN